VNSAAQTRETIRAAFTSLWAHRMRSVLTTLGIIIGVASVISVVQLTKALEARIMADINKEGSLTFFLRPWMPPSVWKKGQKIRWQPITPELVREMKELVPEVQIASPEYFIWGRQNLIKIGEITRRVSLHAMDENGMELANLDLECGRGFAPTDRISRAPVMILGNTLAKELDLGPESLGRTFTVAGQTAELIGILKKQGDIPFVPQNEEETAWGPDNEAYIPTGSFKELLQPWTLNNMSWRLQVDPRMTLADAEELLRTNMRRVRGLKGDDPDNFELNTNRKQVEMVEKLGRNLLLASGAMVSISLLVGGIGVMNIMLVNVTERTREIGVRKALGARRRTILMQFLVEAVVLCLAGGVLGVLLGLGLGSILSRVLMKTLGTIPLWALASSLAVPAFVGIVFGLYPARRASKLDPIEALRYE
jgi:putative ABC transport system permease protein